MDKDLLLKMRKLAQVARQQGRVLPVSQAFVTFPIEDEEHKGKVEHWTEQEAES